MAINDPRDIPGLVAWFSAEAETGYADGAQMASWTDLSGKGNHATGATNDPGASLPLWRAATGSSGGPAVHFPTQSTATVGWFWLPAVMAGATAGEVALTVKSDVAIGGSNGTPLKIGGATGSLSQYSYWPSGNNIADDFGSTARKTVAVPQVSTWFRAQIWSAAGDWGFLQDGVSRYTTTSNTVGWRAGGPLIGGNGAGSTNASASANPFQGAIGCLVLYSRKLTTTERADLDAWLAANPSGGSTVTAPPTVTLTGTAPAVTGTLDATATTPAVVADLAGTAPTVAGSFAVEQAGVGVIDLSGAAPGIFGSFEATASGVAAIETATDAVNRHNGMTLVTEWQVEVEPPVTEPKRQRAHDYAIAVSLTNPTLVDGRPT